jgi:NDP-sugar pyrophosphorylase family protein
MNQTLGFGLAAGEGIRLRPLTLKANGYMRSKAAVRFLGERIIVWMLKALHAQGLEHAVMFTRGKENHTQVKGAVGYGEALGMRIRYSPTAKEGPDIGSAGAVLQHVAGLHTGPEPLFVFPIDSLLEFDLAAMLATHRRHRAAVTIAIAQQPATSIAGQYGLVEKDHEGRVRGFLEKPSLECICAHHGVSGAESASLPALWTNAGFYVMDPGALQSVTHQLPAQSRRQPLDLGGDLLPWLVEHGYPVYCHPVQRMGDLGNIPAYLETMYDALAGCYPTSAPLPDARTGGGPGLYIDPTSWTTPDPVSGLTLQEKVAHGLVALRSPVRIGRNVRVGLGTRLDGCNIDDDCTVGEQVIIQRSSIGASSCLGPHSRVSDTVLGTMVRVQSTRERPVLLSGKAAIGDEAYIAPGVSINARVCVNPRDYVPAGAVFTLPSEKAPAISLPHARISEAQAGVA